jgi:hypothetical protein
MPENDRRNGKEILEGEGRWYVLYVGLYQLSFASDDELPRICMLVGMFTDQAMSFTLFSHSAQR